LAAGTLSAGSYSITAKATDNNSGVSPASTPAAGITVSGNTAPTVSLTYPPATGATLPQSSPIPLTATASDSDGIAKVEFFRSSTSLGTGVLNAGVYGLTLAAGSLAQGTYSITATATDSNASPASATSSPPNSLIISGGGGGPVPTKKILHWQATNNNRINTVVSNKAYIDTLPFDGLVLSANSAKTSWGLHRRITPASHEVHPIQGQLLKVTNNYLNVMPGNTGTQTHSISDADHSELCYHAEVQRRRIAGNLLRQRGA
jgi:hypothetical protein